MRCHEVSLVLLALILCLAPRGSAAPVTAGKGGAVAKMYTRGNHWAVGHLMGKKRVAESPQLHEEESLKEQLKEYVQWEEATRNLLNLLQAKAAGDHQLPQWEPRNIHHPAWDAEDVSNFKDAASHFFSYLVDMGKGTRRTHCKGCYGKKVLSMKEGPSAELTMTIAASLKEAKRNP